VLKDLERVIANLPPGKVLQPVITEPHSSTFDGRYSLLHAGAWYSFYKGGVSPYLIPGKPQSDTNKAIEAANLALLTEVAHSSTRGEVRVVAGAGHEIQETHPEAVVTAVDDLLTKIRR